MEAATFSTERPSLEKPIPLAVVLGAQMTLCQKQLRVSYATSSVSGMQFRVSSSTFVCCRADVFFSCTLHIQVYVKYIFVLCFFSFSLYHSGSVIVCSVHYVQCIWLLHYFRSFLVTTVIAD